MIKRQLLQFSWFSGTVIFIVFLSSACLNPIDFNPNNFKLNVNVSGSIKIDDVAVMWLINRTKTANVTSFTISRPRASNETDTEYAYPKNFSGKPNHGESLASYHVPSEIPYAITVVWQNPDNPDESGVIGPFNVQFPRAQDYKYYLYRTLEGDIVLVNEDKMKELPPNPDANYPDPQPSSINAQTFVVINVTPDQNIDVVEFARDSSTYIITNEPKAKDQKMILLGSGSYNARAYYIKDEIRRETNIKNAVVTKEDSSMAFRTNYLYFYKTIDGDYQLTQVWPPIPNDASYVNKPEDALNANQGILEIINNATPHLDHDIIAKININGSEYPNSAHTGNYMAPGEVNRYIVDTGPVHVSFMPQDQQYYGQLSTREIQSRKVTVLPYTNNMGNPFAFPEDAGYGSGLIRIVNNSTGVVTSIGIYDKNKLSRSMFMGYEGFNPPRSIQYGKTGMVPVVGSETFPLIAGANQLVQVVLETPEGVVVVERMADLRGNIITIEINQSNLGTNESGGGRKGSRVIVENKTTTPTTILGLYVYNKDNEAAMAVYPLTITSPPGGEASIHVLSTIGLPIVQGGRYRARLIVYGNGLTGVIEKEFSPDDQLYSVEPDKHLRHLVLTQNDLKNKAPGLIETFVPATDITVSPSPYDLLSITESDLDGGNKSLRLGGALNLNHLVTVKPANASKKSPISWSLKSGATGFVSLGSNGVLTVTGIAEAPNNTVTLGAVIQNAAGDWASFTDLARDITIRLSYQNTIRTNRVTAIRLVTSPVVEVEEGHTLDLKALASLNPPLANINGVPITTDDLVWAIIGPATSAGSSISNSTFKAGTAGDVTVQATLPANRNGGGSGITATTVIRVVRTVQPFVPVTGITVTGGSLVLPFYTQTNSSGARSLVGTVHQINLTAYTEIKPSNATVQSPISWQIISTNAPANTVEIRNDHWLSVVGVANNNNTVRVKATIPNAKNGSQPFTAEFNVTLQEHNSRLVSQGELSIVPATIMVGEKIDLSTLVTMPANAHIDAADLLVSRASITKADLVWEILSGGSYAGLSGAGLSSAGLSGAELTGISAGTVNVKATLPAARNGQSIGGTTVTAQGTITIAAPLPVRPNQFTLRLIKTGGSDSVVQIVLIPVTGDAYPPAIHRTGHTRVQWAHQFVYKARDPSHKNSFMEWLKQFTGVKTITITNFAKEKDWVDVAIDWPAGNITGYHIFFIEGDNRVRGYANPGTLDPAKDKNFLFFLRPDYLYDNYLLPMGTTKTDGYKQVNPSTTAFRQVIPIGYDSWNNTTSIMKPGAVDTQPIHDLSDF
ncbi:MAG: hypothetical protein LBF63_08125 [Treponema sp.]|nr:hypothetical protein [Treponema sp.]